MTNNNPSAYFDRAKALQEMILNAQEDLKQLRADALEELGVADMAKEAAKEIRKDLAEVFAIAKIEVKGEIERRNQAAKMARRKRIAEECGVQLDLLDDGDAGAERRMAGAAAIAEGIKQVFGQKDGVKVELRDGDGRLIARGDGAGNISTDDPPHDPETGEIADDEDEADEAPAARSEPAEHLAGMSAADLAALTDVPSFLRRT